MTVYASGKFVGPLLIVLYLKPMGYASLEYRRTNLLHPNVEILCSKSEKTTKYLCGEIKKGLFSRSENIPTLGFMGWSNRYEIW